MILFFWWSFGRKAKFFWYFRDVKFKVFPKFLSRWMKKVSVSGPDNHKTSLNHVCWWTSEGWTDFSDYSNTPYPLLPPDLLLLSLLYFHDLLCHPFFLFCSFLSWEHFLLLSCSSALFTQTVLWRTSRQTFLVELKRCWIYDYYFLFCNYIQNYINNYL